MNGDICGQHANQLATRHCVACRALFCDACVKVRDAGVAKIWICPECGGRCEPVKAARERSGHGLFLAELPRAFVYPLRGSGMILILLGAAVTWGLSMLAVMFFFPYVLLFCILGYVMAYVLSVIGSSAGGEDHPPDWPDFLNVWSEVLRPLILALASMAVSFLPATLYALTRGKVGADVDWVAWTLTLLGVVYLPMALLGASLFGSLEGLVPWRVVGSIVKVAPAHLLICVLLAGIFVGQQAVEEYLAPGGLLLWGLPSAILSFYILIVEARLIGLIYYAYEERLNWFPTE